MSMKNTKQKRIEHIQSFGIPVTNLINMLEKTYYEIYDIDSKLGQINVYSRLDMNTLENFNMKPSVREKILEIKAYKKDCGKDMGCHYFQRVYSLTPYVARMIWNALDKNRKDKFTKMSEYNSSIIEAIKNEFGDRLDEIDARI